MCWVREIQFLLPYSVAEAAEGLNRLPKRLWPWRQRGEQGTFRETLSYCGEGSFVPSRRLGVSTYPIVPVGSSRAWSTIGLLWLSGGLSHLLGCAAAADQEDYGLFVARIKAIDKPFVFSAENPRADGKRGAG